MVLSPHGGYTATGWPLCTGATRHGVNTPLRQDYNEPRVQAKTMKGEIAVGRRDSLNRMVACLRTVGTVSLLPLLLLLTLPAVVRVCGIDRVMSNEVRC